MSANTQEIGNSSIIINRGEICDLNSCNKRGDMDEISPYRTRSTWNIKTTHKDKSDQKKFRNKVDLDLYQRSKGEDNTIKSSIL